LEISLAISEGTINEPPKVARRKDKRPKKFRVFIVPLGEWAKLMACKFCRFADTRIIDDSLNKHGKKDGIEMKNRTHLLVRAETRTYRSLSISSLHNPQCRVPEKSPRRGKREQLFTPWRGFTKMYRKNFSTSRQGKNFGNL
jgi:hypothetical protein